MDRRSLLLVTLVVGAIAAVVAIVPALDLRGVGYFFDPQTHTFPAIGNPLLQRLRDVAMWVVATPVTIAAIGLAIAIARKLIAPHRPLLFSARAAIFLIATIAIGPGLVANKTLKDHWGRYRPIGLTEFGGTDPFVPFWDPRGTCYENCSFISGEGSGAFWMIAPAALAPPPLRPYAYAAAVAFGIATGAMRISFGAHFPTDVLFAGYITYVLIWLAYALIYRWPATRLSDEAIGAALTRAGEWLHALLRRKPFRL